VKALDLWLLVSFFFTFLVLVEYCLVLYLVKAGDWYEAAKNKRNKVRSSTEKNVFAIQNRHRLAYKIENWSRVGLPMAFSVFMAIYATILGRDSGVNFQNSNFHLKEMKF